ncbi:MAG: serine/threonine-protein kinase, partial [Gemmatimonadaceae bacterium]|nr:serine/threonine-protein kinase [Gemmatimonadaceae bacterium]
MTATGTVRDTIGPYRVVGLLGEGGMGAVYECLDAGPVKRRVAVKVVRPGTRSSEVQARFDAERQALALMDHPGIARVLGAGETDAGESYFVMELVKGLPITEYADHRRLATPARIALFIDVCHAVQHAHQKGVLHRDLKPSNILVAEEDGAPRPKVIDFGIAKAIGRALTEDALVTSAGVTMGTPAYMSPEQAESSGFDIDTRSDIYALGVVLYELLVGRLPVDPKDLGYHAFLARLTSREITAPRPSDRLPVHGNDGSLVAHARRTDTQHLRRELRGDLDWVVLKALEPDRARRYPTANALALDLQRAQQHEPVSARPPSARYRVGKFVRRHRIGVAAAVLGVAALTATSVLATLGLIRATRAERQAAADAAAAREVTDFVVGLFRTFDPDEFRGTAPARDISARELLDRGAQRAASQLDAQPLQQGRILQTIGVAYQSLGFYDEATRQLERAMVARRAKGDYAAAATSLERARRLRAEALGPEHADVAQVLGAIAVLEWRQGRLAQAESILTRLVALDERTLGPDDPTFARHLMALGVVHWSQQRFDLAEPLFRRTLQIRERQLGIDHPELAAVLNNLGAVYFQLGRYPDALTYYERTRGIYSRTLDSLHPNLASVLNNIGETQAKLGRTGEAEALLQRALAIKEARLAAGNPSIATTLNALANVWRDAGRLPEAERAYRRALALRIQALPPGDA